MSHLTNLNGPAQVAANLANMAMEFKSADQVQVTAFRKAFKEQSKNDLVRSVVYLLEVVGNRDVQFKALQNENKDLRELLKLNDIDPDKEIEEPVKSVISNVEMIKDDTTAGNDLRIESEQKDESIS